MILWTILACWVIVDAALCGAANFRMDSDYSGKWKDEPRLKAEWKRVEETLPEALKKVEAATGLTLKPTQRVELGLVDATNGQDGVAMAMTSQTSECIIFHVQRFLRQTSAENDLDLIHELTHSVMRASMGLRHDQLDRKIREGVAVWVAGQVQSKMDQILLSQLLKRIIQETRGRHLSDEQMVDNMVGFREQEGFNYVTAVLGVEWVAETYGPECLKTWLKRCAEEGGWEALASTTNLSLKDVEGRMSAYVYQRLVKHIKPYSDISWNKEQWLPLAARPDLPVGACLAFLMIGHGHRNGEAPFESSPTRALAAYRESIKRVGRLSPLLVAGTLSYMAEMAVQAKDDLTLKKILAELDYYPELGQMPNHDVMIRKFREN